MTITLNPFHLSSSSVFPNDQSSDSLISFCKSSLSLLLSVTILSPISIFDDSQLYASARLSELHEIISSSQACISAWMHHKTNKPRNKTTNKQTIKNKQTNNNKTAAKQRQDGNNSPHSTTSWVLHDMVQGIVFFLESCLPKILLRITFPSSWLSAGMCSLH